MNRRGFFKALGIAGGAALAVAKLPVTLFASEKPTRLFPDPPRISYRGVPLVYSREAMSSRIYFLSKDGPYVINDVDGKVFNVMKSMAMKH